MLEMRAHKFTQRKMSWKVKLHEKLVHGTMKWKVEMRQ